MALVEVSHLTARVPLPSGGTLTTVDDASFSLESGKSYAIVGKSGSGKTSLVSILGLLNAKYEGEYLYREQRVADLSDRQRAALRAQSLGFVFQNYSLIGHLSAWENVALPLAYARKARGRATKEAALGTLDDVGLASRADAKPAHLSGGEQQRVAIARALVGEPELLICDEPTGALDTATGKETLAMLSELVTRRGLTMLLVTHDRDVAAICDSLFEMRKGRLHQC